MNNFPIIDNPAETLLGENPNFDAWFYTFKAENNIEHHINPTSVASHEQLCFMVALEENRIYAPCSDATFHDILVNARSRKTPRALHNQYNKIWLDIIRLCKSLIQDKKQRKTIINYCRLRFIGLLISKIILPSRVAKRLVTTFISQLGVEDPWINEKIQAFQNASELMLRENFQRSLKALPKDKDAYKDIQSLRQALDVTELTRLIYLAAHTHSRLETIRQKYMDEARADVFLEAEKFTAKVKDFLGDDHAGKTFLYLCDLEGGLSLDLAVISILLRLGHKVILAVKELPMFFAPTIQEIENSPLLENAFINSHLLKDTAVSKNKLLKYLHEKRFLIISDGTGEQLNLYRVSITFARAWKECDFIFAKGLTNKESIFETTQQFTRDILCFWEENDSIRIERKARAPFIHKFSEAILTEKARSIVRLMRTSRNEGKAVMFYSCIIGSIPGETKTAVEVAQTFIHHLRERAEDILIINPAEYFEKGMDGDDLMYMWEQVQRSGLINVWRFQTMEDIETSFALMGRKVPPIWSGKDSTYSTGCTKEMRIALDIQKIQPELQIIGPSPEKFFRRNNYSIGKFHGN